MEFWVTAKIAALSVILELGLVLEDMATIITHVATKLPEIAVTRISKRWDISWSNEIIVRIVYRKVLCVFLDMSVHNIQ